MTGRRQKGFTLVEILVALFVFSLVAAGCVYSLRLAIDSRERLAQSDSFISEWRAARTIIRDDMLQLRNRPVRDEFGAPAGPAFLGGEELALTRHAAEGERLLVAFVRGGWANPESQAPRSDLQYVEYVERNGALIRRVRPYLDDARGQPRAERVLFKDVKNVDISFLSGEARGELDWVDGWPVTRGGLYPSAVTIAFDTARFGHMTQRFWIGDLGVAAPGAGPS